MMSDIKKVEMFGDTLTVRWDGNTWVSPHNGQQHAHARDAMRSEIEAYYLACGEDLEDEEIVEQVENHLANMTDKELSDMAATLNRHGTRFAGNNANDEAREWMDHGFRPSDADEWCEIGVWDAATAAEFRESGLTPDQVKDAAESLTEGLDDPAEEYTDGDPIYAACNGDIDPSVIVEAAK